MFFINCTWDAWNHYHSNIIHRTYPWYLIPAIFHAYKIRSRRLPCQNISWVFFLSMLLFVLGIILYKFLYMVKFLSLYLIIIMLAIVTYFTKQKPIIHSNQPLTSTQICKNHMLCIIFSITEYLGLIVLSFLDCSLALMPAIALIEIFILTFIRKELL